MPSRDRLRRRHTETAADLDVRMARADQELGAAAEFDHVVVNDDVDRAVAEIAGIISSPPPKPVHGAAPP